MQQIVISFNYQNENAGKKLVLVLVLVKLNQHWYKHAYTLLDSSPRTHVAEDKQSIVFILGSTSKVYNSAHKEDKFIAISFLCFQQNAFTLTAHNYLCD